MMLAEIAPLFLAACFLGLLAVMAVHDWRTFRIPDVLVLALGALGLAQATWLGSPPLAIALWGGLIGLLLTAMVRWGYRRWRGHHGLGLGDVKATAALGLWLGPQGVLTMLMLAALAALAWVAALRLAGERQAFSRDARLAFGPWLALAAAIVWIMDRA